ncbi:MAG: GIY-YIG nuclease family protein [Catalinimonas sp.]
MSKHTTDEDRALLGALGVDTTRAPAEKHTPRQERIIAGFEEIERFVAEHGRAPQHGEARDIFERLYAVRLDRMRASEECRTLLQPLDARGLLRADPTAAPAALIDDDEALLASLGVGVTPEHDVTQLRHVRSREEIRAAEEVAQRTPCQDFDTFKPLFERVQQDLQTGKRKTIKYRENAEVKRGDLFVLDGQKVVVADLGEPFVSDYGRPDRRLRVVYDNGTESDLLMRSLQRALNKDEASRRIKTPGATPLFSNEEDDDDLPAGHIYVLRSRSDHPFIAEHRSVVHKIGVTGSDVKSRIANARKDPTYLLADVEIVATYKLENIDRRKLEGLLHKVFSNARLDLELPDRFGASVKPREWYLVPHDVIEKVIDRIRDGTIDRFRYDPAKADLVNV